METESSVEVMIYRTGNCSASERIQKELAEFNPKVFYQMGMHDSSEIKDTVNGFRKILGKCFKFPIVVIQCEDFALVIGGYYNHMISDIRNTIMDLKKGG